MLISRFNTEGVEQSIKDYEIKHNMVFPSQYKEFLLKYNGGRTPDTNFKIGKISSDLTGFYGFGKADQFLNYDLFEHMGRINDFLEDEMIPIGDNVFGDYILMGLGVNNKGIVFFFYHDRPKKYFELAADFKTFISKCKSEKIGHIRTIAERKASQIEKGFGDEIPPERIAGWQAEIDLYSNINQEELILE